jgi:hypothetical protein
LIFDRASGFDAEAAAEAALILEEAELAGTLFIARRRIVAGVADNSMPISEALSQLRHAGSCFDEGQARRAFATIRSGKVGAAEGEWRLKLIEDAAKPPLFHCYAEEECGLRACFGNNYCRERALAQRAFATKRAATATPFVDAAAQLAPHKRSSVGDTKCQAPSALSASAVSFEHIPQIFQTTVLVLVFTYDGQRWILASTDLRLPQAGHTMGKARASAVSQAGSLARQMIPALPSHHCSLAADLPKQGVRVVTCPGVVVALPSVAGWKWWSARQMCDSTGADSFFTACALAATISLAECPSEPERSAGQATRLTPLERALPTNGRNSSRDKMAKHANLLRTALLASADPAVRDWADFVGRLDDQVLADTPDFLLLNCPVATDQSLRLLPFVGLPDPPCTEAYTFPVNGIPPPGFKPKSFRDLMPAACYEQIGEWTRRNLRYLLQCREGNTAAVRGRVEVFVITQEMLFPAARGVVWHNRGDCLVPADFESLPYILWNRAFFKKELSEYPDQELASFIEFGSACKTDDVGLTAVFGPHLCSLALGFNSVSGTVDELIEQGRYNITDELPYFPFFAMPQGSVGKSGGSAEDFRRISDAGSPRKTTEPPAMSLNEASRKAPWVREIKPSVGDAMQNLAILLYAGEIWKEPVFLLSDDLVGYFTQIHRHGSELWKSGFFWHKLGAPAWVVEYVLGFGQVPNSNIGQRAADAFLWILMRRVAAVEASFMAAETCPHRVAYFSERRATLGETQACMLSGVIYTDDPFFGAVGPDRTARLVGVFEGLKRESRLLFSDGRKRQIGNSIRWNGVYFNASEGYVVVPSHKALRASTALQRVVTGGAVMWRDYQSLVGLLEHIRFALILPRVVMFGMYLVFRLFGGSRPQPEDCPKFPAATIERSAQWLINLAQRPGTFVVTAPLADAAREIPVSPSNLALSGRRYHAYTDAALAGAVTPSYGGYMHGYWFSHPIPEWLLGYPIPQQEMLAIILGEMLFGPIIVGALVQCHLSSDSKTSVDVLTNDGAHTEQMQFLHEHYTGKIFASVAHVFGEANPQADFASRGRFDELFELAAQLGVSPRRLEVPPVFIFCLEAFRERFGPRYAVPKPQLRSSKPPAEVILHGTSVSLKSAWPGDKFDNSVWSTKMSWFDIVARTARAEKQNLCVTRVSRCGLAPSKFVGSLCSSATALPNSTRWTRGSPWFDVAAPASYTIACARSADASARPLRLPNVPRSWFDVTAVKEPIPSDAGFFAARSRVSSCTPRWGNVVTELAPHVPLLTPPYEHGKDTVIRGVRFGARPWVDFTVESSTGAKKPLKGASERGMARCAAATGKLTLTPHARSG